MVFTEIYAPVKDIITNLLQNIYSSQGDTCYPLANIALSVQNEFKTRYGKEITYNEVKKICFTMRSCGILAMTSKPLPLIALRHIMEIDRLVYYSLKHFSKSRLSLASYPTQINELIATFKQTYNNPIDDQLTYAILGVFLDQGIIVFDNITALYLSMMLHLIMNICKVEGVECVLFADNFNDIPCKQDDNMSSSKMITYSQVNRNGEKVLGDKVISNNTTLAVFVSSPELTTTKMQECLMHLSANLKIVFLQVNANSIMQETTFIDDIKQSHLVRYFCFQDYDIYKTHNINPLFRLQYDIENNNSIDWIRSNRASDVISLMECETCEMVIDYAHTIFHELSQENNSGLVIIHDNEHNDHNGIILNCADNQLIERLPQYFELSPCDICIVALIQCSKIGLSELLSILLQYNVAQLVLVMTTECYNNITVNSSLKACRLDQPKRNNHYSCLRKLLHADAFDIDLI